MPKLLRLFAIILGLSLAALNATAEQKSLFAPSASGEASPSQQQSLGADNNNDPEFLPVEEAYMLSAWVRDGKLILHWDIEPGYYLYRQQFSLQTLSGETLEPEYSPSTEKYDEYFEKNMQVYYSGATLTLSIRPEQEPFTLKITSQGCADAGLCYPPRHEYTEVNPAAGQVDIIAEPSGTQTISAPAPPNNGWLIPALAFALLGGIILNLMPCVFPVLSIKVLSLASAHRERLRLHGWAYTAGIVLSFVAFAGVLMLARAGGEAIGWGFQLQSPLLIAALCYLFLLMGLALSGLLNIGSGFMGLGQGLTQKSGLSGSFFTGVLAAVVASPCTAPFMGAALGYAMTQPIIYSLAIFAALGFGMALPLLALCYFPRLVHHLPQPGPWMDTLKQALAFPLYLTALWLLWVLGRQAGSDAVVVLLLGVLSFAFALWLKTHQPRHKGVRTLLAVLVLIAVIAALSLPFIWLKREPAADNRWQPYSAERLSELRADGRGVFVNLTADWCLTCLANERITLNTDEIEAAFERYDIATLKGDWTNHDPAITELLEQYQRSGVPLYLWFAPGSKGKADVLPQLLRKQHLLEAFSQDGQQ
ncbi:protein-disulfide reductase DsbD family protein [Gilvimarinus xylanilyticus]|uniref:Protein-disulfide reductase DsbD n=1 Tax=Gilvimarinus xylanilyticus TaxID=2944139 RepID=A0A9X2KV63_9GAMM|nr:protein-disulfide reductase DsbD [Gilvimarinus xylanilyticus]MCP8897750.1 protein-disulfide reductase DsbD [Gilvimarinus xylanilyticus]